MQSFLFGLLNFTSYVFEILKTIWFKGKGDSSYHHPFLHFQINMQRKMRFTGIVTQGASRMGTAEFIKAFKVASSLDGRTYTMYRTDGQRKDYVRQQKNKTQYCSWKVCFPLLYVRIAVTVPNKTDSTVVKDFPLQINNISHITQINLVILYGYYNGTLLTASVWKQKFIQDRSQSC